MKNSPASYRLPRSIWAPALALIGVLYLVQGLYFARFLVPAQDGIQYPMIGVKAVRGEIGLYDDRLIGNRLPLPFYALGLTQLFTSPSLRAARWFNVAIGLITLWLTIALARKLAGDLAGILAGLFLATQGVVVAYYSYEGYPAFAALSLMVGLFAFSDGDSPKRRLLGTALLGLLFFVRSNLWPVVPLALGYSLWKARRLGERVLLVAVVVVPPLIFFGWDQTHLKLLAYVPVLRHFVAPLGYVSATVLDDFDALRPKSQLWEIARVVRRYEFWALAAAVPGVIVFWRAAMRRPIPWATKPIRALAALLGASVVGLFMMYPWNFRWIGLYFVPYAPLTALLLGVSYAGLVAETKPGSWPRSLLIITLACIMAPPLYFVRNPLLPIGEMLARDPYAAAHRAAAHLKRIVPGHAKVFFYGLNEVYFLSGLPHTYLQQVYAPDQFVKVPADDRTIHRSGFVTANEMRYWLTTDADYAVIDFRLVEALAPRFGDTEKEMLRLVDQHFEMIDRIDEFPNSRYVVYRRR